MQHLVAASGRFVGHGHDSYHIISALYQTAQALDRKIGSAEKYYLKVFLIHRNINAANRHNPICKAVHVFSFLIEKGAHRVGIDGECAQMD